MRCLFAFILLLAVVYAAPAGDLITNLPGIDNGTLDFNMYSGYVNIDEESNTNFFYWFCESQNDPANDPVFLWLNGGPGASSLLGLFTEHGPVRVNPDGETLAAYPFSWNRRVNIIYLESPIGVGFSYSDVKAEYITNDNKTAQQNYDFLTGWFDLFPEYQSNDFYITGESYGGKYCPQLANVVLDNIQAGNLPWLNMKGIIVGNPGTESDWYGAPNEYAYMTMLYQHFIIPQAAYANAYQTCGWSDFIYNCDGDYTNPSTACKDAVSQCIAYVPPVLDAYSVYSPVCHDHNGQYDTGDQQVTISATSNNQSVPFYPCLEDYMATYLNDPSVQAAIHANPTNWNWVSEKLIYLNEYEQSVVPLWQRFISETDWRILVASGDADSAVPTIGTQRWINCLGQPVVNDWRPWMYAGQTAGFIIDYEGISFTTIKGCGHMIPYYCPELGYEFFDQWLDRFY